MRADLELKKLRRANVAVNPYQKRIVKNKTKAVKDTDYTVDQVSMDTNKTRRKTTKERTVGQTAKKVVKTVKNRSL